MGIEVLWIGFNQVINGRMEELAHALTHAHALPNHTMTKALPVFKLWRGTHASAIF